MSQIHAALMDFITHMLIAAISTVAEIDNVRSTEAFFATVASQDIAEVLKNLCNGFWKSYHDRSDSRVTEIFDELFEGGHFSHKSCLFVVMSRLTMTVLRTMVKLIPQVEIGTLPAEWGNTTQKLAASLVKHAMALMPDISRIPRCDANCEVFGYADGDSIAII